MNSRTFNKISNGFVNPTQTPTSPAHSLLPRALLENKAKLLTVSTVSHHRETGSERYYKTPSDNAASSTTRYTVCICTAFIGFYSLLSSRRQ